MLLPLSGWKPGMLLNIVQCTGEPSHSTGLLAENVSSDKAEKHSSKGQTHGKICNLEMRRLSTQTSINSFI